MTHTSILLCQVQSKQDIVGLGGFCSRTEMVPVWGLHSEAAASEQAEQAEHVQDAWLSDPESQVRLSRLMHLAWCSI